MPVHHPVLRAAALVLVCLLGGCAGGSTGPVAGPADVRPRVDPAATPASDDPPPPDEAEGPHEVTVVADFGPLPDGSGDAVVEMTWTVDGAGTTRLVVDTPAGVTERHVMTEDEHWWWLSPAVRETVADAEWIHFDLRAIEEVGGVLPEIVTKAREAVLQPGDIVVGHTIAGREVLGAEVVSEDEVRLTLAGIERPVIHRRRALPSSTAIPVPSGAVDVTDLPDVLRW